ncbi:helix-turn-helix transcriptional regulator [Vibrio cyclitrophicus]
MTHTFAHFLEYTRKERGLTQQEMLELLVESDLSLSKLDLTTFSRWERGVTTPKLTKQLLIARVLGEDVTPLIDSEVQPTDKRKSNFDKSIRRTLNPYLIDSDTFIHNHDKSLLDELDLCQKLSVFHLNYLGVTIEAETIQKSKLLLSTCHHSSGTLVGHCLYGFVPSKTKAILCSPSQLSNCPLLTPELAQKQPVDMYIVSTFGSLSVSRMSNTLMILDILRQNTHIKNVILNSHDQETFNLYDNNTECEVLSKGEEVPFGGVKIFGKHYKYAQIKMSVESILATKVVSSFVPFTQENIHTFLNDD